MKKGEGAIILTEQIIDDERVRTVLHEWGYGENEIQRILKNRLADKNLAELDLRRDESTGAPFGDMSTLDLLIQRSA